ncbi:LOW QUALITY PROTEIN: uncharacterized protein EMH_0001810 [Eimeria mitis]|uniref:Uncharacterized protein n=1 Tax=Eimeria mitis TaxID=44415 RepID=U6JV05_9EIME|nr:LOW QUALITY PROTEIN: uncharacterized protein EMH_0001810 [Eimeria mitis]CDJ28606.1 hypothetical protein, conserved [Eimeria mitis]
MVLPSYSAVSVHLRPGGAAPLHSAYLCTKTDNVVLGSFALHRQQKGNVSQGISIRHIWQQAAAAAAIAAAAERDQRLQQQQQQPQKQQQGAGKRKGGKARMSSAGRAATTTAAAATATAAANVAADPRALDGVYSSSFYLSFVAAAAAHAATPVATAATDAGSAPPGRTRLRGANQKRQAAIERLLRLRPQMLPSVARVAAAAARMQPRGCIDAAAAAPAGAQTLWREELATVLRNSSAAAAATADRAFWNAFAVAAADAAEAFTPAELCSIAAATAAAAAAGAPGWKGPNERHQQMLLALQEQIRRHAHSYTLPQLLISLEALQSLQRIPSAATAAVSAAATAATAETAAFAAISGEPGVKKKAAAIAAAAAAAGDLPFLLQRIEGTLHTKLTQAAQRAAAAAAAAPAAATAVKQPAAAGQKETGAKAAAAREERQPVFCRLLLRCLRLYAAAEVPCPALLEQTFSTLASRCTWFSTGQLVELAELLLQLQPQETPPSDSEALHALNARLIADATASEVSLQQLLCLADTETAAAAAAAALPDGTPSKDQNALMLLHCLLQQQALGRPELLQLLPTLLQELQHQQKQQQYLQWCGLVLSVCSSSGVQLLELWEELLGPLLQLPVAEEPAAAAQAAAAGAPWGGWLLSRPLLQHVEAAVSAACFCGVAGAGAETSEEKNELLSAAASAAAHAAATAGGFLSFLLRSSSSNSRCLSQLTGESLEEMAVNICGLYRVQSAAAVLLHLLPQQHSLSQQHHGQHQQRQQLQQHQQQQQQPEEDCTQASPAAAAEDPSPSLRGLLAAAFPEWQQLQQPTMNAQQLQEGDLQQELQKQQQMLLQQQSGLVFELLLEFACRGSPKSSQELPPTLLLLLDGSEGEVTFDPQSPSVHPTVLSFLQSAARGAAALRSSSENSSSIDADSSSSGNPSNSNSSASNASSALAVAAAVGIPATATAAPQTLRLHLLYRWPLSPAVTVVVTLLGLLLIRYYCCLSCSARLSAAANRYLQHLEKLLLAARVQQRHKGVNPRTLSPNAEA